MLLGSGISLAHALELLAEHASHRELRAMTRRVYDRVIQGTSLSEALKQEAKIHRLVVRAVSVGERSGMLAPMLEHVSQSLTLRSTLRSKLIGALMYPLCIAMVTCGVVVFLLIYIFPKVLPLFASMHVALPLPTRLLLGLSHALITWWWAFLVAPCVVVILVMFALRKSHRWRRYAENVLFRTPIAASCIRQYILADTFHILGMLQEHGMSLPDSLGEVREGMLFKIYEAVLNEAHVVVVNGSSCIPVLARYPRLFGGEITGLLAIAEQTGDFGRSCTDIGSMTASDLDTSLATLTRFIEPALMLGMGGVVGMIAVSIIMPMYEITSHVTH